jgi:hypothetical protein
LAANEAVAIVRANADLPIACCTRAATYPALDGRRYHCTTAVSESAQGSELIPARAVADQAYRPILWYYRAYRGNNMYKATNIAR